jgi:hypothetical protein
MSAYYVSIAIDHYESRPCVHCVRSPDAELAVVDYRMGDFVAPRRVTNTGRIALCDIFAAVHPYDSYVAGIPLLDLPQLRKNVNAIDSAVRPEVEKDHVTPKTFQRERLFACMDPVEARREFGCANTRQV